MTSLFTKLNSLGERKVMAVLVVVTAVIYLALINADPTPSKMEARNLVAARECVRDGHWFVTTMNGVPRIRKPPLPTWLAALAMKATGDTSNIHVARLPNVVVVGMLALFVYLFARKWLDKSLSLTASLVAVTSLIMCGEGRRATWDIFTVSFAFGGIWMLHNALARDHRAGPWAAGAGLMWGLSFLSKGPVTMYSVLLPFLLAMLITGRGRNLRWRVVPVVLALAVPIGMSWWTYMYFIHPETFAILGSEAEAWHTMHTKGFFYYSSFPLLVFPWTLALIGSFIVPLAKNRNGERLMSSEKRREILFFLLWFGLSMLLLSLVPEKKNRYTIVLLLPVSLAVAIFLGEIRDRGIGDLPRILKGLWFLQLLQVPVTGLFLAGAVIYLVLRTGAPPYVLVFIPVLVAAYWTMWRNRRSVEFFVVGSVLAIAFLAVAGGIITKDAFNKDPRYDIGRLAQVARITSGHRLYTLHLGEKIIWNIRRTSTLVGRDSTIENFPAMMLIKQAHLERFRQWTAEGGISYKEIYRFIYGTKEEGYILFELSKKDGMPS